MATFPRGFHRYREAVDQARLLERVVREEKVDVRERVFERTAADSVTLRGIPAIGHGVQGVIRGTQPEAETMRELGGE